jgi:hypothetical protein
MPTTKHNKERHMSKTQYLKGVRRIAALAAAVIAPLALVAPAMATEPTGNYKVFKDCPYENEAVKQCVFSETNGGKVILGNAEVPIVNQILLQGGSKLNFETEKEEFFGAKDGKTLAAVAQPVPGGLLNLFPESALPWWLRPTYKAIFENKLTGVNAITELAKPANEIGINSSALVEGLGVALTLPVKIRLENPLLGGSCYIGSAASPVTWKLTTGTTAPPGPNKPLAGFPGEFEFIEEGAILKDKNLSLVDNAYSAPAAAGCGGLFSFLINPLVNAKEGLPAAAGKNTTILNGNLQRGYAPAVRESVK